MKKRIPAQCFHPGEFVKDEMEARGWDVAELARQMRSPHVPEDIVRNLVECKQPVIPIIAFGLSRAFGISVDFWMNLQKAFDSWKAAHNGNAICLEPNVQRPALHAHEFVDSDVCKCGVTRKQVVERGQ